MFRSPTLLMVGLVAPLLLQGCASSGYSITVPVPSQIQFQDGAPLVTDDVSIRDGRGANPEYFSFGILPAELRLDGVAFDPIDFLRTHVAAEMRSRGLRSSVAEDGELIVDVKTLRMRNHRTNAYTPFITLTMLSADLEAPQGSERVGIFIARGKVPVWSFSEVVEPIFTQPMDLLVKELVAKLSRVYFDSRASDDSVRQLVERIQVHPVDGKTYLDVYQLGFSNNRSAILPLVDLTSHSEQYVRLAAISSLGILRAEEHVDLLKSIQEDTKSWSDRAMALKALGDIGTSDSLDYLRKVRSNLRSKRDKESAWNVEIIDLYMLGR